MSLQKPADLGISPIRETVLWFMLGEVWDHFGPDVDPVSIVNRMAKQRGELILSEPEIQYLEQTARWIARNPGAAKFVREHRKRFAYVNQSQPFISRCDAVRAMESARSVVAA